VSGETAAADGPGVGGVAVVVEAETVVVVLGTEVVVEDGGEVAVAPIAVATRVGKSLRTRR
jgi:hypothetical protein